MTMAKPAPKKEFKNCPAGPQRLVLADVVDLGVEQVQFGNKITPLEKIRLVFQSERTFTDDEGKIRRYVVSEKFTNSLFEKSNLSKRLCQWLGVARLPKKWVEQGFDLDKLIGRPGFGVIAHVPGKNDPDKIFANIASLTPMPEGMEALAPDPSYVRVKDREQQGAQSAPARSQAGRDADYADALERELAAVNARHGAAPMKSAADLDREMEDDDDLPF